MIPFKISTRAEVVTSLCRSVTATSNLTSAGCHLTPLASDLGRGHPKVHLYGTFVSGLRQGLEIVHGLIVLFLKVITLAIILLLVRLAIFRVLIIATKTIMALII
jgi:hypothetical protein